MNVFHAEVVVYGELRSAFKKVNGFGKEFSVVVPVEQMLKYFMRQHDDGFISSNEILKEQIKQIGSDRFSEIFAEVSLSAISNNFRYVDSVLVNDRSVMQTFCC